MESGGSKKYDVPAIIVLTVDTMNVVEMNKQLMSLYGKDGPKQSLGRYDVRIHKLFARHIKPEEQAKWLAKVHPGYETRPCLNVYIGTPNRLTKLLEMKAFRMDRCDTLKLIVLDCRLNKKSMSLFEDVESKKDAMEVLAAARGRWKNFSKDAEKRLRVALV